MVVYINSEKGKVVNLDNNLIFIELYASPLFVIEEDTVDVSLVLENHELNFNARVVNFMNQIQLLTVEAPFKLKSL